MNGKVFAVTRGARVDAGVKTCGTPGEDAPLILCLPELDTVDGDNASSDDSPSLVALALAKASKGSSSSSYVSGSVFLLYGNRRTFRLVGG